MPYRREVITHDDGSEEVFDVRISKEGFLGWLRDREMLGATGHPDRPPDVDTETLRVWLQHPGEEGHPYFDRRRIGPVSVPLAAVSIRVDSVRTRWLLNERDAGDGYEAAVLVDDLSDGEPLDMWRKEYAVDREVQLHRDLVDIVELHSEVGADILVTGPLDYEFVATEAKLAEADIDRGFISPLPEPGTVQ